MAEMVSPLRSGRELTLLRCARGDAAVLNNAGGAADGVLVRRHSWRNLAMRCSAEGRGCAN
jgi:hypothetical protein